MQLSQPLFQELRVVIHALCGLALAEDKLYLVEQRLEPVLRANGCATFQAFAERLRGPAGAQLREPLIEAITTNETSFFRDGHPFDTFREQVVPWLVARVAQYRQPGPRHTTAVPGRIWCAAASTGQEPYSLAMVLLEYLDTRPSRGVTANDFSILATDISARVLAQAQEGRYSDREIARGLNAEQIERHFQRSGDSWVIQERVRQLVTFRRLNLVLPFAGMGPFDVICCRNVLIYFDDRTRKQICERLYHLLTPSGLLLLGSVENLYGVSSRFESAHLGETIVYRKRPELSPTAGF